MKILLHTNIKKQYKRLIKSEQQNFKKRRNLFLENPFDPLLNNHALHGIYKGYRSINITGNLRVIYQDIGPDTIYFIIMGTHTELYD